MNKASKSAHQIFLFEKGDGTNNHCVGVLETVKSGEEIQEIVRALLATSEFQVIAGRMEVHGIPSGQGEDIRKKVTELLSGNQ